MTVKKWKKSTPRFMLKMPFQEVIVLHLTVVLSIMWLIITMKILTLKKKDPVLPLSVSLLFQDISLFFCPIDVLSFLAHPAPTFHANKYTRGCFVEGWGIIVRDQISVYFKCWQRPNENHIKTPIWWLDETLLFSVKNAWI